MYGFVQRNSKARKFKIICTRSRFGHFSTGWAKPGRDPRRSRHGPTPGSPPGPARLPVKAGRRSRDDRAPQGQGLGKRGKSLMEVGTGRTKPRVPERGELLAWEKVCKDIRTEFYSKKTLLTLETSRAGEVQT